MIQKIVLLVAGVSLPPLTQVQAEPKPSGFVFTAPARAVHKKGEIYLEGMLGKSARAKLPNLDLSATSISVFTDSSGKVMGAASKANLWRIRGAQDVVLKADLKTSAIAPETHIEARSDIAHFDSTTRVLTLRGNVNGSYDDANGRHAIKGQIVTFSVYKNSIAVVQDGAITLAQPAPVDAAQ